MVEEFDSFSRGKKALPASHGRVMGNNIFQEEENEVLKAGRILDGLSSRPIETDTSIKRR